MIINSQFQPPWWLRNRHLQTLYPALFRKVVLVDTRPEQFELADGDFIDLVWTSNDTEPDSPVVIVLHGLEGSIDSPYARGLLNLVAGKQWTGVLMHFRGCSGRHNRLDRSYHSGDTDDLHAIVSELKQRLPGRPIAAIGISLGGNVLIKYLGEQKQDSLLSAAIVASVPFDLTDGANTLGKGLSRLYQRHLISHIRNKMQDKFRNRPAPVDMQKIDEWRDFYTFDDNVTAPLHGFKDVHDYYQRSSSKQFLGSIAIPTLVVQSRDDPFISARSLPADSELSEKVTIELTEHGGHVGFIYADATGHLQYWLEKRCVEFIEGTIVISS